MCAHVLATIFSSAGSDKALPIGLAVHSVSPVPAENGRSVSPVPAENLDASNNASGGESLCILHSQSIPQWITTVLLYYYINITYYYYWKEQPKGRRPSFCAWIRVCLRAEPLEQKARGLPEKAMIGSTALLVFQMKAMRPEVPKTKSDSSGVRSVVRRTLRHKIVCTSRNIFALTSFRLFSLQLQGRNRRLRRIQTAHEEIRRTLEEQNSALRIQVCFRQN